MNLGFVPVCGAGGEPIGTITDRDLAVRVVASRLPAESTLIEEVMTREVVACRPTDELEIAEALMCRYKKSRVTCTNEAGKLVGVISLSDVAEVETRGKSSAVLRSVAQREAWHL